MNDRSQQVVVHHAFGHTQLARDVVQAQILDTMQIERLPALRRQFLEIARDELQLLAGCQLVLRGWERSVSQSARHGLMHALADLAPADPIDRDVGGGLEEISTEIADSAPGIQLEHAHIRLVSHVLRLLLGVDARHQKADKRLIVLAIQASHQRFMGFRGARRTEGCGIWRFGRLLRIRGHGPVRRASRAGAKSISVNTRNEPLGTIHVGRVRIPQCA